MKLLLGMVLGVVLVVGGVLLYLRSGLVPVATSAAPMPFEESLADTALRARMSKEAPSTAPMEADTPNLLAGAQIYRESCAVCHGLSGQAESAIAKGMFPKPPQFFAHAAQDHPVGQTYWAVKNGIRLTGMPGFGATMSDQQLWQVSLLLSQRDQAPESILQLLREPLPAGETATRLKK
jgi:thiosulfate dehydrogenase